MSAECAAGLIFESFVPFQAKSTNQYNARILIRLFFEYYQNTDTRRGKRLQVFKTHAHAQICLNVYLRTFVGNNVYIGTY